ncbi:hypothetical protein D9615_007522 [Tricholomella constricta]|uniref:SET domain-containing protein n=1 Tax=Tricholomella constricta TaxID=117010 RepID=A0A8H5H723_9AGAR|nr:hypothetical protein D9615_007522 [Tricholomella constricta]
MPAKDCATSSSSSPAWCRSSSAPGPSASSSSPPPPHICAKINAQVATNPALARPDFDFAAHVQSRSYTMHNFVFQDFEAAVLLDEGVERLLPDTFQTACPPAAPLYTFEIGDAGAKGLGMFALRDIPSGALVLVEHPVIVAPYLLGMSVPLPEVYAELFGRLPAEACHELMALANSRSTEDCDLLEGIVRTNALGIQLEVPDVPNPELTTHRAVFLNTSRCNHSCGPNARWEWDTNTFALYLSAVRPIQKGEEITINYISCTQPRHERHATLFALYNFTCACPSCALPSFDAIQHSDCTRLSLAQFWDTQPSFEEWCLDAGMPADALVKRHLAALRMIKQEGLQVLDAEKHVDAIAMCYGALADLEMFRAWTGRVRDAKVHADPAQALVFAKWLSNPAAFPAWGWKKTFLGKEKGKV